MTDQAVPLREWGQQTAYNLMLGVKQELGLKPYEGYVPKTKRSSRVLTLRMVGLNPHYLPSMLSMRDKLTMWARLGEREKVRIGWDRSGILIEVPLRPAHWRQVTIDRMEQNRMFHRGSITLGLGIQDQPIRFSLEDEGTAHVYIAGQTRSGKTNTQKICAWHAVAYSTPSQVELLIFDVAKRGYKWRPFNNVQHLAHPVITEVAEADRVLTWLVAEIERRADVGRTTPRLIIVIDELKALGDESRIALTHLSRIAAVGGEFGLHLILATQYPQVKMLGSSELKRNVTTRLVGKVDDAVAAYNATGLKDTGAESLQGYGDFLLKDGSGLSRLAVVKADDKRIEDLPRGAQRYIEDLPEVADVQTPPNVRTPEPMEPEHLYHALVSAETSYTKIGRQLRIGTPKARVIFDLAQEIKRLARDAGQSCFNFGSLK